MPTIQISDYVKDELDDLKDREQHKSYDSAMRTLLGAYDS